MPPKKTSLVAQVYLPPSSRRITSRHRKEPNPMPWFSREADSIPRTEVEEMCRQLLDEAKQRLNIKEYRRVLLLPPDLTRAHSGAGWITETLYKLLPRTCDTHVIPTLGQ